MAVAAVFGAMPDRRPAAPSAAERSWLDGWGVWRRALYRDTYDAERLQTGNTADFLVALRPLVDCDGVATRVGPAPDRYRGIGEAIESVCREVERLPELGRRMVRGDSLASSEFGLTYGRTSALMTEADDLLEARLSFNRPLPRLTGMAAVSHVDPELSAVATEIAGKPTEARCWSTTDWNTVVPEFHAYYGRRRTVDLAGFAEPGITEQSRIHLAPDICRALAERDTRDPFPVVVLAHESEHILSPSSSEAVTECIAMQETARTATLLGMSRRVGRKLAERYWRDVYRYRPQGYYTSRCYQGSPLDQTPGDGLWP